MKSTKRISLLIAAAALGLSACTAPAPSDPAGYPGGPNYPTSQYPNYPHYPTSQYPSYPDNRYARWGTVESIEVVGGEPRGGTSGIGAIGGAIAGGLLGNQVGHGAGRAAATVGGAVAGGVIGNEVEKRVDDRNAPQTLYRFRVRMDDGSYQTFTQETHENLRPGDRVRIDNGRVWAS
jgi:outer membrane lipoprotein SlyB